MKKVLSIILTACLLVALFSGCGVSMSENMIVGTWTAQVKTAGVVTENEYTFYEDGTGVMTTVFDIGIAINYVIDDTTLTITTDTPALQKTSVYTYEFDGTDVLILTDENGEVMTLTQE